MAKIVEEVLVIKLSRIVKGEAVDCSKSVINKELVETLETVASELVGEGVVVEVVTE